MLQILCCKDQCVLMLWTMSQHYCVVIEDDSQIHKFNELDYTPE
jgi:hypothetical protein